MSYPPEAGPHVVVDLTFDEPSDPQAGPNVVVDLTFGATAGAGEDSTIAITGRFGLRGSVGVNVDAGVFRGHSKSTVLPYKGASRQDAATRLLWSDSDRLGLRHVVPIRDAQRADAAVAALWINTLPRVGRLVDLAWIDTQPMGTSAIVRWGYAPIHRGSAAVVWQDAAPVGTNAAVVWQEGNYLRQAAALVWQQGAAHALRMVVPWYLRARLAHILFEAPWQEAAALTSWGGSAFAPRPRPRPQSPTGAVVDLRFCAAYPEGGYPPYAVALVLGVDPCGPQPGEPIFIPVRSCYVVQNEVTLYRLPSGVEFEASSFTLDIDRDSWTFSWSASLHASAKPHLARTTPGERVQVECVVNSQHLRLSIDNIGRDRRFPEERIAVRGRGRGAALADVDLTFGNTAARTAQQLMQDVLTINGVSFGWSLDWQITDWLVPADTWVFNGSYIAALQDIAGAAGAYLQPHLTDQVIRVLPRYPLAPWHWAASLTPDIVLPVEVTSVENIEEVIRPDYNQVHVGGLKAPAVFGPVTRDGTGGDKEAPQVLHSLITASQAWLQRGIAELSDTGMQEHVTVQTMVLPEMGIVMPGTVISYVSDDRTRKGIVRKTGLEMQQWPELWQNLGVETHVD